MRIGILKADETPRKLVDRHGRYDEFYVRLLAGGDFQCAVYPVFDGVFPHSTEEADGWFVTGSKHSAWEELPWILRLKGLIQDIYNSQKPLVGICFGHQVIASALGGRVERYKDGWTAGPVKYARLDNGQEQEVLAFHQDQVTGLPPEARVVGSSDTCEYAVLRYGDNAFTMQFHPELTSDYVRDLLSLREIDLPVAMRALANRANDESLQAKDVAAEIVEFFKSSTHAASAGRQVPARESRRNEIR